MLTTYAFTRGARALWVAATLRDLALVMCGVLLVLATPQSLQAAGITGFTANLWATMLILGGSLSIAGSFLRMPMLSAAGCFTLAGNLFLWAWAAASQAEASLISYSLVCLFVALALANVCNGLSRAMWLTGGTK